MLRLVLLTRGIVGCLARNRARDASTTMHVPSATRHRPPNWRAARLRLVMVGALVATTASPLAKPTGTYALLADGHASPVAQQPACPSPAAGNADAVETTSGTFRGAPAAAGTRADAVTVFKGIPFAAPPVGELRWRPPAAPTCRSGITDASSFGPVCPQIHVGIIQGNEDCLTLNIWVPKTPALPRPLPVMVWVHGGGNAYGAGSYRLYDGARLADRGSAIVVTFNYRLGPLGYLALPQLRAESPHGVAGNYGLLDQMAALRWVQTNIAAFGGDPTRVLAFGESGGGRDVCALIASPLAAGLFTRALLESPPCDFKTLAEMEAADAPYVSGAGCSGAADVLACLRGLSSEQAVRALPSPSLLELIASGSNQYYAANIDGYVLPAAPLTVVQAGQHNKVPVVVGSNAHEASMAVPLSVRTEADYQAAVTQHFGATVGAALLRVYPAANFSSPRAALIAMLTDVNFTCQVRAQANALVQNQPQPVYRYVFNHGVQGPLAMFGAFHGAELFYVFGTYPLLIGGGLQIEGLSLDELVHSLLGRDIGGDLGRDDSHTADRELSEAMMDYWARFTATGDPNGAGAVAWPQYNTSTGPYLELGAPITGGLGFHNSECDAIAAIFPNAE
jgi:para-nitrobenzyl esterase